jgi:hypothetical protein
VDIWVKAMLPLDSKFSELGRNTSKGIGLSLNRWTLEDGKLGRGAGVHSIIGVIAKLD